MRTSKTALLIGAILWALCAIPAAARQSLPVDPATGQPFPDLTASCSNQIGAGTTLNVTSNYDQTCLAVHGTLNITALAGQTLTFKMGTLLGYPGCAINVTSTAPGSKVDLVGKDIPPTDQVQYGSGWLVLGCQVRMNGRPKTTITRYTAEAQPGQTTLAVADTAGVEVGDQYILADSRERDETVAAAPQVVTVSAISAGTLTVTPANALERTAARDANGVIELLPHVGNLSRSIRFRAENPNGTRPHLLLFGNTDSVSEYVEFTDCGRTTLDPASQIGRYCLHHHFQTGPYRDTGISVWNTPKWGPTFHHSDGGTLEDSVVYNAGGAGVMTEMSSEANITIRRNLVVQSSGAGRADFRFPPGGVTNTCFWVGPLNRQISNYAYNCQQGYAIFGATTNFAALAQFDDNEAWGNWTSFECWECLSGGIINRFKTVNNIEGLYNYSVADLVYNDFWDRGDPRKTHNLGYLAHNWSGDYMAINTVFNRPNIQNRNQGINLIYGYAMNRSPYTERGNSTVVRDGSFCNNVYDIRFSQAPGSSELDGPYTHTLINNHHCNQSQVYVAFEGPLRPFQTRPIVIQVEDFQGNAADDFRVYNNETAPANATTRAKILDKVVGGSGGGDPDSDGDGIPDSSDACPTVAGAPPNGCPAQTGGAPSTSTITQRSGPTTIQNGQQLWKFQSVEGPAGTWQSQLWGTDTFKFNVTVIPGSGPLPVVLFLHGAGGLSPSDREPMEFIDSSIATAPGIYINPVSTWYVNGDIDPVTGSPRGEDWWMGYADSNGVFQPITADRVVRYVQWVLTQTSKWNPDPDRVYVQGGSMGGGGAQKIGLLNPNLFAAVVGVTGWIDLNAWVNGSYCKPGMRWRTTTGPLCTDMHDSIYLVTHPQGRRVPLFLTWSTDDPYISPTRYPELFTTLEAQSHAYQTEWRASQHAYFQIAGDPHLQQRLNVAPSVGTPSGDNPATTAAGTRTNLGIGPPPPPGPQVAIQAPASVQKPNSIPFTATCETCVFMTMQVDGQDTGQFQGSAPWNWTFNSANYAAGPHVIRITGRDAADVTGFAEHTITVTDTPQPIDCQVSAWSAWSAWTPVPGDPAHEQRTRTRTVTQQPANGGASCPPLTETEVRDVPPPPDPCVATPLTVTVQNWPSTAAGSRQFRYTASQPLESITLDNALRRAVFRDTRGCSVTVIR